MILSEIGTVIRQKRKELKLTQEELAKRAKLSRTTLSRVENGYFGNISVATFDNILSVLGLTIELKAKNPFMQ